MIMLLALSAPALAVAHAPAAPQPPDVIIVTGNRLPEGAAEIVSRPGGTDLVAASEYQNRVAVSLRDALAFSPGVYAQPRFGQEVRLSIRGSGISRGFHMRGLTLLLDGVPINLADDNGDFQELDPTILDRLEVYRGANAFRFGGTTLGGAINGVTPTGLSAPGFKSRGDGGSFDTFRSTLSAGFGSGAFDGWAAVAGDRSDGDRDHADRKAARLNGNLGWKPSDTFRSRFYVNANRIRQELPGALPYATVTTRPRTGNSVGDQARDIDSLRIQNRTNLTLGRVDLEGGGFVSWKSLYHPIFQVVDQESVDSGFFGRTGWTRGALQLWAGATARFGTVDAERYVNVDGERAARTFAADQKARTVDLYGEARFSLGNVTAIGGLIYTSGRRTQKQTFPVAITGSANFNEVSPRLGLLWEPRNDLQLYANISRSHELPGFIELAQVAAFVPLDAQHAWTGEVGARGRIGPIMLDLSFYRAAVRNELLQFTVGPDIPASTFNAGKTLHQGIEAGIELPIGELMTVRTSYQFNDFRFVNDRQFGDNRLPVIPKHVVRSEIKLGTARWAVAPGIEWVPRGAWADYANSFRAGGHTLFNVTGSVTVLPTTDLFVDVRNLANRKGAGDISAVINYAALSPAQRAIFYPVERRGVFLGLRSKFGGAR